MKRELPAASRPPLFSVAVLAAVAVLVLLLLFDPSPHAGHASTAPPPVVIGGSISPAAASPHAPRAAVALGRRFLRLYARLQTEPLDARAVRQLRSLASLVVAQTLLDQPPQPAGGGHARAVVARIRVEGLSSSAVRMHAAVRLAGALLRVRCLVQRDTNRWTVTALTATA